MSSTTEDKTPSTGHQVKEDDQHKFDGQESILGIWPRVPHANVLVLDKQRKEAFLFDSAAIRLQDLGINDPEYIVEMERWLLSELPEYRLQYFNRFNGIPRDWLLQYEDRCCVSWMTLLSYLMINYPDDKLKMGKIKTDEGTWVDSRSSAILKLMGRDTFVRYLYVIYCRYIRRPTDKTIKKVLKTHFTSKMEKETTFKKNRMRIAEEMLKSIYIQDIELPVGYNGQHMGIFWIPDNDSLKLLPNFGKKKTFREQWIAWSNSQPAEINLASSLAEDILEQPEPYQSHTIQISATCRAELIDETSAREFQDETFDSKLIQKIKDAKKYLKTGNPYNNYFWYRIIDTLPDGKTRSRLLLVVFSKFIVANPSIENTSDMIEVITDGESFSEWIKTVQTFFPSSTDDAMTEFLAFTKNPRLLNEAQYMSKLNNDLVANWFFTPKNQTPNYVSSTQFSKIKGQENKKIALKLRVVQYNLTRWMVNWYSDTPGLKTDYLSKNQMRHRFASLQQVFFGKNLKYGFFDKLTTLTDPKNSIALKYNRWKKHLCVETDMIKNQLNTLLEGDARFFIIRITKQGLGKKPRGERSDQRQIFWKKYYEYGQKIKTARKEKQYRRALKIIYYIMGSHWREAPSTLFVREDQEPIAKKQIISRITKWEKSGKSLDEFIGNKYTTEVVDSRKKELLSACQVLIEWGNPSPVEVLNKESFVNTLIRFQSQITGVTRPNISTTFCQPNEYLDISPLKVPSRKTKELSCKTKLKLGKKCLDHESCGSYYCKDGRCQCWVGEQESLSGICEPKNIILEEENIRNQPKCLSNEYRPGDFIQFNYRDTDSGKITPTFGIIKERLYLESQDNDIGYKDKSGKIVYCYRKKEGGNCRIKNIPPEEGDILCHYDSAKHSCRRYHDDAKDGHVVANKKTLHYSIQYRKPNSSKLKTIKIPHQDAFPGYWNPKYRSCSSKRLINSHCKDPEQCLSGQCHANPLIGCTDTKTCGEGMVWDVIKGECIPKKQFDLESFNQLDELSDTSREKD